MFFSQAFTSTAMPSALSTLTNFLFLPHGITWSTWSYKRFTDRLHAPNHTTCIMQCSYGVALQSPSLLLFALFPFPSPDLMTSNLQFLWPFTLSLQSLIEKAALSAPLLPSTFSLRVSVPSFHVILLPVTPTLLISFLLSPLPTARGEKFDSWYCYIMKGFQQRARPPSELNLQFCFLSFAHSVGLALRS